MIPYLAAAQAVTVAAAVAIYFHGQANTAACQRDSAADAMTHEVQRGDLVAETVRLRQELTDANVRLDAMADAARIAGVSAANRALAVGARPAPPITGSGPEDMNRWIIESSR